MYDGGIVVLIGMMGSGKTTVGRELATLLDVPAVDNDDLIAMRGGAGAAEILRSDASRFRQLELDCIAETLNVGRDCVFSVGGGAPATEGITRLLFEQSQVVWIQVPEAELYSRLKSEAANRPMLDGDLEGQLHSLLERRESTYKEVADIVVDGASSPNEVASMIAELL